MTKKFKKVKFQNSSMYKTFKFLYNRTTLTKNLQISVGRLKFYCLKHKTGFWYLATISKYSNFYAQNVGTLKLW